MLNGAMTNTVATVGKRNTPTRTKTAPVTATAATPRPNPPDPIAARTAWLPEVTPMARSRPTAGSAMPRAWLV